MKWKESFMDPVKSFYEVAKREYEKISKDVDVQFDLSEYTAFFTNVKIQLLDIWNTNIVFQIKQFL